MNNKPPVSAVEGEGALRLRRWPWLRGPDALQDFATLCALPPVQARAYEQLLREEYRVTRAFHKNVSSESALDDATVEQVHGHRAAHWKHGAGGGRRRPTTERNP